MNRPDDPRAVMAHADRFYGGKALIVLGGPSGKDWQELRDRIQPDVILTANGATRLPGATYWMLTENMHYCHNAAQRGSERLAKFLSVLDPENTAETLLISHRTWPLLPQYGFDLDRCIRIRRKSRPIGEIPADFTLRKYGDGFLSGGISHHSEAWHPSVKVTTGTVGLPLLHMAGILGCAEVHTVGFDLMFKGNNGHHWYTYPKYEADRFRTEQMFVDYKGAPTQLWWIETADYLKQIEYLFERDGLQWIDHSGGLLTIKGLQCTH